MEGLTITLTIIGILVAILVWLFPPEPLRRRLGLNERSKSQVGTIEGDAGLPNKTDSQEDNNSLPAEVLKRYFDSTWSKIAKNLSNHLQWVSSWMSAIKKGKNDRGYFPYQGYYERKPLEKLDREIRQYDLRLAKAFDSYVHAVDNLTLSVDRYNDLVDPTTPGFIQSTKFQVYLPYPEGNVEKEKEEYRKRVESALKICKKYISKAEGPTAVELTELANNEAYQRDLANLETEINQALDTLCKAHTEMSRYIKVYSA
jgi:hypothetical protein